ncbi:hypothetical protein C8T65DRAFT_741891 [Cerioporus squamosus]|nr:hypothetical protein C8T65DRAFT_741891 [Cerioporus squamosus]
MVHSRTQKISFDGIHTLLVALVQDAKELETQIVKPLCSGVRSPKSKSDKDGIDYLDSIVAQVDEAIYTLNAVLSHVRTTLRRHRNALVNINTLPDEILLPICIRATEHPTWKSHVANTCSRWRSLCHSSPSYWTEFTIPDTPGETHHALLAAAGLHLNLTIECRTFHADLRDILLEHRPRVRQLSVLSLSSSSRYPEWLLDWSWPELRKLYIDAGNAHCWLDRCIPLAQDGIFDNVQELTLVNCRFPHITTHFLHLRKLSIEYDSPPMHTKYTSARDGPLYCVLTGCPGLEDLILRHPPVSAQEVLPLPFTSNPRDCPAPLLALRRIRLDMYVQTIGAVLENILTSPDTLSTIDIAMTNMRYWAGSKWNKELLQAGGALSMTSLNALPAVARIDTLSLRYGQHISGRASGSVHHFQPGVTSGGSWRPSASLPRLRVTFGAGAKHDDDIMDLAFDRFLAMMIAQSCLSNVQHLELEGYRQYTAVIRILHATPRLKTLVLEGKAGPEVLAYIARRRAHSAEAFVPELQAVTLSRSVLSEDFVERIPGLVEALRPCVLYLERCQSKHGNAGVVEKFLQDGLDVRWPGDAEDDIE